MNLVIQAHTLKNEPLSQPITGRFDERGGTIGRSDTNTLALPDPERHISRLHAEVWFSNGSYAIRNVGSANAILVNGRTVAPGEGAPLNDGDEVVVGAYAMRVSFGPTSQIRPVDGRTVIKASAAEIRTSPPQSRPAVAPAMVVPQPPAPPARPVAPPVPVPPAAAPANDPFADLFGSPPAGSSSASDPFADLLAPVPAAPAVRPAAPPPAAQALPAPAAAQPAAPARLPDDFDPFADLAPPPAASAGLGDFMAPPAAAPATAKPAASDPFADLFGGPAAAPSSSLDDLFGIGTPAPAGRDPLADFLAPARGDSTAASQDPLALFGGSPPAPPARPAAFDHTPELKGAYRPPAVQTPPPAAPAAKAPPPAPIRRSPLAVPAPTPRPFSPPKGAAPPRLPPFPPDLHETTMPAMRVTRPLPGDDADPDVSAPLPLSPPPAGLAPTPAAMARMPTASPAPAHGPAPVQATGSTATADALWAAFCQGAGIKMDLPQGLNPDLMRVIGEVLRHSVDGTLKLVAVRAAAKQELRAQVTTIQSRNNNPLKFSPDAAAAIEQLLQPPMRGFMVGPQAVNDVMDDLLGHAIGTMAGMRAALTGVLSRFEPSQLEGKLGNTGVFDALLPMNRRAKLWELYLQHYQRIQGDAEEDFHELFGKAFIRAYEDQLDRLDSARHPDV